MDILSALRGQKIVILKMPLFIVFWHSREHEVQWNIIITSELHVGKRGINVEL